MKSTLIFIGAIFITYSMVSFASTKMAENNINPSTTDMITNLPSDTIKEFKTIVGSLSGKTIKLPNVNKAPMPSVAPSGFVLNGEPFTGLQIANSPGLPDARSYKKKFALLIPFTNTVMEHELWSIILNNENEGG